MHPKGRPRGGASEGSGQGLTLFPWRSNGAQFARFLRLPPEKRILIFAFLQPFRVPNGVNRVAKISSIPGPLKAVL